MTSNDTGTGPEQDAIEWVEAQLLRELYAFASDHYAEGKSVDGQRLIEDFASYRAIAVMPAPPVAVTEAMVTWVDREEMHFAVYDFDEIFDGLYQDQTDYATLEEALELVDERPELMVYRVTIERAAKAGKE